MAQPAFSEGAAFHVASEGKGPFAQAMQPVAIEAVDTWVWLAYDQLNTAFIDAMGVEGTVGVVLIESSHKAQRRPYHQQKLGVLLVESTAFCTRTPSGWIPRALPHRSGIVR